MTIRLLLILVLLASASCHQKPVQVQVRERNYYGIPFDAQDGDAFCVPSAQAGDPIVCVSIAQVRRYVQQQRYAP